MPSNERDLLARLKRRDDSDDWVDAWESLVNLQGGAVYGLALRMMRHREDAEDATQAAWERVLAGLATFRGDAAVSTWLFRITMNECLTRLERRHREGRNRLPDGDDHVLALVPDRAPGPDRHALSRETLVAIERALGELDYPFRAAVVLRELHGLRYEDIAEVLDIPVNTVKTRLHRARLDLQQKLEAFRS